MASIRIPFPEQPEPSIVALTGARITIGRLPFNTVQIIDRIISGFHAELILENGHYRLHDRGSTNGTLLNGIKISRVTAVAKGDRLAIGNHHFEVQ